MARRIQTNSTISEVMSLLESGVPIDGEDANQLTLLMRASESSNVQVVQFLLSCGADVNYANRHGITALIMGVVKDSKVRILQHLIEAGANVDLQTVYGETALRMASVKQETNALKFLLNQGANLHIVNNHGNTPLCAAVHYGLDSSVIILIKSGANVHHENSDGNTALCMLCERAEHIYKGKKTVIMDFLIDAGANVNHCNKQGCTPLMILSKYGDGEMVRHLLKMKQVNVDAQDKQGKTALMKAYQKGHEEVLGLLIKAGANVNVQDIDGDTVLMHSAPSKFFTMVKSILFNFPDLEIQNHNGYTALSFAVASFDINAESVLVLRALIDHGAAVNTCNKQGMTPLMLSCQREWVIVTIMLIKEGAHVAFYNKSKQQAMDFCNENEVLQTIIGEHQTMPCRPIRTPKVPIMSLDHSLVATIKMTLTDDTKVGNKRTKYPQVYDSSSDTETSYCQDSFMVDSNSFMVDSNSFMVDSNNGDLFDDESDN